MAFRLGFRSRSRGYVVRGPDRIEEGEDYCALDIWDSTEVIRRSSCRVVLSSSVVDGVPSRVRTSSVHPSLFFPVPVPFH